MAGVLYIVATPIGNLEDITLRALRVLKEADLIAAEDTRHTQKLLSHYDIHTPLTSYHEHNERTKAPALVERLFRGERVALVSDGGCRGRGGSSGHADTGTRGANCGAERRSASHRSLRFRRIFAGEKEGKTGEIARAAR